MPTIKTFKGDRRKYNEYFRKYRETNREKLREYNRIYNKSYRKNNGYKNEIKWKKNNGYKVRAQQMAQYALKVGDIKKEGCKICGDDKAIMHHDDYFKPLKVRWLCKVHHRQQHYTIKVVDVAVSPRSTRKE